MLKPLGMSESPLKFTCCTELLCLTGIIMNSGLKLLKQASAGFKRKSLLTILESMLKYLVRRKNSLNNNIRLKKQTMPEVIFLNMLKS